MTCSVAVSSSPVFSPSRVSPSLFCKKSSLSNSPENLISSPLSPLKLRLHRPFTALNTLNDGPSTSVISPSHSTPILKRKRPRMLSIPIDTFCFEASKGGDKIENVEVVEDEYSVYCKKGKRETMEDRYSAIANLQGNPKEAQLELAPQEGYHVQPEPHPLAEPSPRRSSRLASLMPSAVVGQQAPSCRVRRRIIPAQGQHTQTHIELHSQSHRSSTLDPSPSAQSLPPEPKRQARRQPRRQPQTQAQLQQRQTQPQQTQSQPQAELPPGAPMEEILRQILVEMKLQREEMRLQREEMRLQREEQTQQRHILDCILSRLPSAPG